MIEKLESIKNRYENLREQLYDPEVAADPKRFNKLNKESKGLEEVVMLYNKYVEAQGNLKTAEEMLADPDPDMKEMAKSEIGELRPLLEEMEEQIKILLIPKDPEDSKDIILEIRSGTGGDEASIFAGDLYRMYSKYFEKQKWKTELLSATEGTSGGYSKLSMEVYGRDVFAKMKFESGAHRVQRVPRTETQGRVHTSAATVAVMPKFEIEEIEINKADLKVDTFRASGAGGQHVNKTESGVRFTHLPTGLVAESTDGRSQIKNREIAIQRLYVKINTAERERKMSKISAERRSLVGSGDRSDKIRTYNYPQNRVTDHRIGLTLYSLDKIMEGAIDDVITGLQVYENAEKLKAGESI